MNTPTSICDRCGRLVLRRTICPILDKIVRYGAFPNPEDLSRLTG